jgi:phosphoglycerate dehydrogenase-like enzyme
VSSEIFRLGVSRDFVTTAGERSFDEQAWQQLKARPDLQVAFLDGPPGSPINRDEACSFDALLIKRNPVDAAVLDPDGPGTLRLRLLARNGVGFDHIDVAACTRAGVMVCTTPDAVARPVASSVMAMVLAFSHELFPRDRMTRAGRWAERWNRTGMGLTGRTLGVVGLGNIGLELLRLAAPWGMRHLGTTRRVQPERYEGLRVETVPLETLLAESDVVALCCPLNDETRGMIDARALGRMQPHALLINTARGEVVDEAALVRALRDRRIGGAGIDVYETEPPAREHPLFGLDNVILGSHNLAYTDEMNANSNRSVANAACAFFDGRVPPFAINPAVLEHPRLRGLRRAG